ncbi:MAG TPA: hydantoinase/oxoprolinase family protein [Acidimicrobiales bacterium]
MSGRAGVDTGGTFTDVVTADGRIAKVPSTRDDPSAAVASGVDTVGGATVVAHGTTVATNAVLERRGARVALVTNAGFRDVIEIGRQNRPSLYDPFADRPEPLVPRDLRFEVRGRLDHRGTEVEPVAVGDLALPDGVEAVAVCLLHADLSPVHERAVADALAASGFDVTCSHDVAPEFREFERTVTTVMNAYVRPVCTAYLGRLAAVAPTVEVMSSAGGLLTIEDASARPVNLLLSGPAGGVLAGAAAAVAAGYRDAVTFDMGGTSTDVCLVLDGAPAPAAQRSVAGFPVRVPSLDIHTIGAGGGSIAWIDPGGALVVGPESAGADPGPACYGRGGERPTVTDADLVLGRIPHDGSFPGLGRLDVRAARDALGCAGVDAGGVVAVVDAAMVQAVRAVTVERGVDPRDVALVAFGGAGPLHACALADALGMPAVVVPPRAGVLSAVGMLCAPRQVDLVRSWPDPGRVDERAIEDALVDLATVASRALGGGATVDVAVDCRYAGQSHELTVPDVPAFPAEHRRRNGYAREDAPIEVVALRATARLVSEVGYDELPAGAARSDAVGPCVLAEEDCTVWVPDGWRARVDESGAWVITRG